MGQNAGKQSKSPAPKPKQLAKKRNPTLNRVLCGDGDILWDMRMPPLPPSHGGTSLLNRDRDPPLNRDRDPLLNRDRDPLLNRDRDLPLNRDPPPPYTSLNAEIITTEEVQTDAKTLTWNTKNFTKLRQLSTKGEELKWSLPFKAGEGTPTPTSWSLDIRINKKEELQFRLNLEKGEKDAEDKQKACAYFTPSVKDPEDPTKILFYRNVGLREYVVDEYRYLHDYTESKKWVKLATMEELESSGALTGDILSIGIHLEIYRQMKSVTVTSTNNKMGETSGSQPVTSTDPQNPFAVTSMAIKEMVKKHFEELLKTGKGADFILRVREQPFRSNSNFAEIKVHKAILSQNPIFAEMMESEMVEKKSGEIDSLTIDDLSLSPLCLNVLLYFIYTGNVHEESQLIPVEVKRAADKYQLPLLEKELI